MKNIASFIAPAALFCWCFFSLQGCKEPVISDDDLLNQNDNLNLAKDTLYPRAFSVFEQPIKSSSVSIGALGNLYDPLFGKSYAGFYAQCRLNANNVSFGENPVLDSAVLTLLYNGSYGKFNQPINLVVYELSQALGDSAVYNTNDAFTVNTPAIGQLNNFTANLTDSARVYGVAYPPSIRIPLTAAFGNKILLADSINRIDNVNFLNLFRGLYVTTTTSPTGNGIAYINLATSLTGVVLYYHNSVDDSLSYTIPVSGVRANHFDNNYSGTPVYQSVTSPNANGESKIYIQGGAGVKGKLLLPTLDSLPKKIAVNKAELILTQANGDTTYPAPLVLEIFGIDDAGVKFDIPDANDNGFGGVRVTENADGIELTRYRFNIKRYMQKLVDGQYHNNGLFLQSYFANSQSERLVLANSSTDAKYKVTLIVTYTKL